MLRWVLVASEFEPQDNATDVVVAAPAESFLCEFLCCCFCILQERAAMS